MKIVLAGTGNVAVVLAKKLKAAGHSIVQVYGRNHIAAAVLADRCGASTCFSAQDITQLADLYVIAIADKALLAGAVHFTLKDQLVVHTAGSVSKEVLRKMSSSYGVLYPYQTIRKEIDPVPEIPFLIDANSVTATENLMSVALTIASKVMIADDAKRMQYHLCAVMTNNFSNYLYVLAEDFCNRHGLDFNLLLPLADETIRRIHRYSPRRVQTGPAIRKDADTIAHHLALLEQDPALLGLYKLFSDQMLQYPW